MGDQTARPASSSSDRQPTVLRTERLILRPPEPDNIERLATIANDKRIARNLTTAFPHPYTITDAQAFIESKPAGFAIEPIDPLPTLGPGIVGMIGGHDRADSTPSVYDDVLVFGYWLAPDAWGHGFATEAGRAYLDHIISTRRPRRIEAAVYGWNPASGRVLEKLGFELEGRMRDRVIRFGEVTDDLIYGLTTDSR